MCSWQLSATCSISSWSQKLSSSSLKLPQAPSAFPCRLQAPKVTGILTRQRASAQGIVVEDQVFKTAGSAPICSMASHSQDVWLRRRSSPQAPQWGQSKRRSSGRKEPEATAAADAVPASAGSSMSQLLAARSEEAMATRKAPVSAASPCPDIDSADKGDPLFASEYASDIFSYYRRVEPLYRVAPDYMTRQVRLRSCMDLLGVLEVSLIIVVHADGHQREDARHPNRLAGRGPSQVQGTVPLDMCCAKMWRYKGGSMFTADAGDTVLDHQPHRPLPGAQARQPQESAAGEPPSLAIVSSCHADFP